MSGIITKVGNQADQAEMEKTGFYRVKSKEPRCREVHRVGGGATDQVGARRSQATRQGRKLGAAPARWDEHQLGGLCLGDQWKFHRGPSARREEKS